MFRLMKQIMTRHQYFLLVLTVIFVLGQVGYTLRMPDYMEMITELVETGSGTSSDIVHSGLLMLGCALAAAASSILAQLFSEKLSASFSRDLRKKIYEHIEAFSLAEMDSFSTASLITRSTNDVTQIQNFLSRGLRFAIMAVTYAVWAMGKIANHYPAWTKLTVIAMVFMWLIIIFLINYAHPRLRKRQEYTDRLSRVLRENLTGIYVIRTNNAEDYQEQKFEHENDVLAESERKAHHAMSLMRPAIKFTSNMLMAGIYLTGASMIAAAGAAEQLTVFSSMVVFSSYTASLIQSFMNLNGALNMYPRAAISADRIKEVLSHSPSIKDAADPVSPAPEGCLEFRHVSFTYPGTRRKALDDISFKVEKGKTLAIIGSTGSGKTTLVNLIPRLYDADEGEILVDGVDVKNIAQRDCAAASAMPPRKRRCFREPSLPTSITESMNQRWTPTRRWKSRRLPSLPTAWKERMMPRLPAADPMCPAARSSASPSPVPFCARPSSISSMTPSPPLTTRRTAPCAQP